MHLLLMVAARGHLAAVARPTLQRGLALIVGTLLAAALAVLTGCTSAPMQSPPPQAPSLPGTSRPAPSAPSTPASPAAGRADDNGPLPPAIQQPRSRWVAARWDELDGLVQDPLFEVWNAWLKSCERPGPAFAPLCAQVRTLSIASQAEQYQWLRANLQPYRVESLQGDPVGLLTGYYEPVLDGARTPSAEFNVPLYQMPVATAGASLRKPWFSRQEMDTLPAAQAALKGREIAYLADPVDALVLQIQGSGRLRVTQPDGSQKIIRLAFAGSNDQPYKSVGRWLIDQGALKDASWPAIKAWTVQNPQRVQEMLYSNPRMVFFKEEAIEDAQAFQGPRGAQGVPLTPGRSIAVDPQSIPYGTPVWLASAGPMANVTKLVMAQDTGSAITGAVRADYFTGWGPAAADLAGRLKQPLKVWVLWPR